MNEVFINRRRRTIVRYKIFQFVYQLTANNYTQLTFIWLGFSVSPGAASRTFNLASKGKSGSRDCVSKIALTVNLNYKSASVANFP
jgi:hypothetical protein